MVPVFRVLNWRGEPKASGRDPFVLEARFVPKPQALRLLGKRPPTMRFVDEPILDWLKGKFDRGGFYQYRIKGNRLRRLHGP